MENKIDEEVPSFISWAMKPLTNAAFDMDKQERIEKVIKHQLI